MNEDIRIMFNAFIKDSGLTVVFFAKQVGLNAKSIGDWRRGRFNYTEENLISIKNYIENPTIR